MPKFLSLIFLLLLSGKLYSQSSSEKFEKALLEEKGGAKVVYSSDKHSFTFDVMSDHIKPLQEGYLSVDNKILQYIFIASDALKQSDTSEEMQKSQLLGYMKYELDYIKDDLKVNYLNLFHDWTVINNKIYLMWYYDMPADKKKSKWAILKQINLSTLCFEHVLNLNTPLQQDSNLEDSRALLIKTANTIKQNDFKINFEELYKELNVK